MLILKYPSSFDSITDSDILKLLIFELTSLFYGWWKHTQIMSYFDFKIVLLNNLSPSFIVWWWIIAMCHGVIFSFNICHGHHRVCCCGFYTIICASWFCVKIITWPRNIRWKCCQLLNWYNNKNNAPKWSCKISPTVVRKIKTQQDEALFMRAFLCLLETYGEWCRCE